MFWFRGGQQGAHRVAFEIANGAPASGHVDHFHCYNRLCVEPTHLRDATQTENQENRKGANKNNLSSGIRGVSWCRTKKKWHAQVQSHRKTFNGGYFEDIEEAAAAARALRAIHHSPVPKSGV
jgi:hypothetical protein